MVKRQWNVGVLLFEYVDVLDYSGPFEVFSMTVHDASQVPQLLTNDLSIIEKPFVVKAISQTGEIVTTHNGLRILPDFSFHSVDHEFDIVIVPGGPLKAIRLGLKNVDLLNWISSQNRKGHVVASVCTGALLLAEASLLTNKRATTNAAALDYLHNKYPDVEVVRDARYVDAGDVLTSTGVSAGIDMSLYMVKRLLGENVARTTANTIDYPYWEDTSMSWPPKGSQRM